MPDNRKPKILITGASGYLAGRLIPKLEEDFEIILGARNPEKLKRISGFQDKTCVYLDMNEPNSFRPALQGIQAVLHLAALNHQDCEKDSKLAQKINVDATRELISISVESGVERFLYLSTIHVYGTPLPNLISEETQPQPRSTYARTHFEAEQAVLAAHQSNQLQGLIIRLANALGAPAHNEINAWGLVTNDLCRQAIQNRHMALNSAGNQERNFVSVIYLNHVVNSLLKQKQRQDDPVFNVGCPQNLTIWELAQKIQERCSALFGYRPNLTRPQLQNEESQTQGHFKFICDKIATFAGHDSNLWVEQEIDQTLKFCRKIRI